jgi:hypothetical protein
MCRSLSPPMFNSSNLSSLPRPLDVANCTESSAQSSFSMRSNHCLCICWRLASMKALSRDYGTTILLCTATQPALTNRSDFDIGFDRGEVREIIPDPPKLFSVLRRTIITSLGKCKDQEIVSLCRTNSSDRKQSQQRVLQGCPSSVLAVARGASPAFASDQELSLGN